MQRTASPDRKTDPYCPSRLDVRAAFPPPARGARAPRRALEHATGFLSCGPRENSPGPCGRRTHKPWLAHDTLEVRPDRSPTRLTFETKTLIVRVPSLAPPGARRRSIGKGGASLTCTAPQRVSAPGAWAHRRGVCRFPRSCASTKAEPARRSRSLRTAGSSPTETVLRKQGALEVRS